MIDVQAEIFRALIWGGVFAGVALVALTIYILSASLVMWLYDRGK